MGKKSLTDRVLHDYLTVTSGIPGILVFPSEVGADFWRRRLVSSCGLGAIERSRVISWDEFKEQFVPLQQKNRPVSSAHRRVFALSLLGRNSREGFFRRLVGAGHADRSALYMRSVAAGLPSLQAIIRHRFFSGIPADLQADLSIVYASYLDFLSRNHLFEPEWERGSVIDGGDVRERLSGKRVVLYFPELLDDFAGYADALRESVVLCGADSFAELEQKRPGIDLFPDYRSELQYLFERIDTLLQSGVTPQEITVTALELEDQRDFLEIEARRRGVPVRIQSGRPLSSLPGASFFSRIRDVLSADFSILSLSSLCMDRSVPWRNAAGLSRLVQFGYRNHCYSDVEWNAALRLAGPSAYETAQRYGGLHRVLSGVSRARTLSDLQAAIQRFASQELDHERWSQAAERVYERTIATLGDIRATIDGLAPEDGAAVAHETTPWTLFLALLSETKYVSRTPGGAVSIYDYRVTAGIDARYHFLTGFSQDAVRIPEKRPFGIRADQIELSDDGNRTQAFITAYLLSGADVRLSCATKSPRSAHIPVVGFSMNPPEPRAESEWWTRTGAPPPDRLFQPDDEGLRRYFLLPRAPETAVPAILNRPASFQDVRVDDASLQRLPAFDHLSATALDGYQRCPFSYLLANLLRIQTDPWGRRGLDARRLGSLYHRVLQRVSVYSISVERIVQITEEETGEPGFLLEIPRWYRSAKVQKVAADACRSNQLLLDQFPNASPVLREELVQETVGTVPVSGRIDLILEDESGLTVIDFKTGAMPTFREIWGSVPGDDAPDFSTARSLQLPLYAVLAEQEIGKPVSRLYYAQPVKDSLKAIADYGSKHRNGKIGADYLQSITQTLPPFLQSVRERMEEGDFTCTADDCTACRLRSICRSCFVIRSGRSDGWS